MVDRVKNFSKKRIDWFVKSRFIMDGLITKQGFTLVESVIAITIIGVIGVVMTEVLSRTFDSNQKTALISNVQQNGQTVLSTFEETIRYSEFVCVGGWDQSGTSITPNQVQVDYYRPILVVFKDGKLVRYQIIPQTSSANGYVAEDFPTAPDSGNFALDLCDVTKVSTATRIMTNNTLLSIKRGTITLLSSPVNAQLSTQTLGTPRVSLTVVFAIGAARTSANKEEAQIGENNEIEFRTSAQFR